MTNPNAERKGTSSVPASGRATDDFVTVNITDQLFGIPVKRIHDVFAPQAITRVPLARKEVAGVLNLRGRIVTAIDVRHKLGLPSKRLDGSCMAVGIESNGESYGLIVDQVGEVLSLESAAFERNPANLDSRWRGVSHGVYRLDGSLLVVLDVDKILDFSDVAYAA